MKLNWRAHHLLAIVAKLYKVERSAREKSASEPLSLREEHSRPLLNDLKTWLDAEVFLPKSVSGKA
ncbi:MAG: transposase, partial [Planctomyces sp.]|nr:transposase [Planctomyces sp.]